MKILHITPSFAPAWRYGGPIRAALHLCRELAHQRCQVRVLTTDTNGPDRVLEVEKSKEVEFEPNFYVRYCPRVLPETVSPTLLRLLPSYLRWADVVHLTAVYNFPTIPTLFLCKLLDKPVVWSPRGALQRWKGSRHKTLKAIWGMVCKVVAPKQLVLQVTSEQEAKESQKRFPKVKVAVIPNGVEIPDNVKHIPKDDTFRLVYLGRLDPKKGIENLLEACAWLKGRLKMPWTLTIAGGGNPDYVRKLEARTKALSLLREVKMLGEVKEEDKGKFFGEADVVIIPSYTENFAMVVAEALAHGVPVIASKGTPWKQVEEIGCGLWVDNDPESLVHAIEQVSRMPLREMGERGRAWMAKEFSWQHIAKQMVKLYQSLL